MKKVLICLLCAVLLCGLFACGKEKDPTAAEKTDEPTAEQTTEEPPAATDAPAFSESDARPLTFAEDADTLWIARGTTLLLYPEGTGILTLHKNNYQQHLNITERDGTFLAEIQMYRTPFDSEPAYCFPAGELRLVPPAFYLSQRSVAPQGRTSPLAVTGRPSSRLSERPPYFFVKMLSVT